jgi:dipeptidyl aminopeptidase/acylaminoacyl peptidase
VAVDGKGKPENLTKGNLAADGGPQFSPDGKKLAWRAQKKAGYEADQWDLMIADVDSSSKFLGPPRGLLGKTDKSTEEFAWDSDRFLYLLVDNHGQVKPFAIDTAGVLVKLSRGNKEFTGTWTALSISPKAEAMALAQSTLNRPPEAMIFNGTDPSIAISSFSRANEKLSQELDLPEPEIVQTIKGADDTPMQMWILKPPGFDPSKKWPVAYLVHGGPQGAWHDGWSYRWCPALWAAQGYIVALPNPRGSTGFGQKYVDEISGDWGGKCYVDLMKGVDYLESLPYVDKDRIGAAGASFGGYMMNWFAVNSGRFKCLITHCSVWNFDSMYGTTDEIWFDEWEHGGPPWGKNRESYEKHSPHRYAANLGKFKTPMLVIHNDLDFRCPIGQGHELFTALQRQGVPSKMINFPDEGHWVLKPANSRYWHQEVFGWLKKYVPPGGR